MYSLTKPVKSLLGGVALATRWNSAQARDLLLLLGLLRVCFTSCMYSSSRSSCRFRPWVHTTQGATRSTQQAIGRCQHQGASSTWAHWLQRVLLTTLMQCCRDKTPGTIVLASKRHCHAKQEPWKQG